MEQPLYLLRPSSNRATEAVLTGTIADLRNIAITMAFTSPDTFRGRALSMVGTSCSHLGLWNVSSTDSCSWQG